jgi:hypothetical protein
VAVHTLLMALDGPDLIMMVTALTNHAFRLVIADTPGEAWARAWLWPTPNTVLGPHEH